MNGDLVTAAPMTPDDLDEIMPLERQCFADPWTRRMYLSDLTTNEVATYLVVRMGPLGGKWQIANSSTQTPILAYGGFWLLMDEAHIATIASHPDWRGCGLGQWLMLALFDAAVARGAASSTLEVRAGNLPAKRLYEKLGYEVTGVRKRYYRDGEDGLIMTTPPLAEPAIRERLIAARQDAQRRLERCFGEMMDGDLSSIVHRL